MGIVRITKERKVLLWNINLRQLQTQKANKCFPLGNNTIFTNCAFFTLEWLSLPQFRKFMTYHRKDQDAQKLILKTMFLGEVGRCFMTVKFVYFSRLLVISCKNLHFFCFQLLWVVRYCSISLYFSFKEESTWEIRVCLQKWSNV